jgi:peptidoglycan/LPS O-acetylase OafA/YrhL
MIHQNNFAALRIFAALLVVMSHSWSLSGHHPELIAALTNGHLTGGALGVIMFFSMSGFLVSESYLRTQSTLAFLEARMLRLFPALAACLIFGILIGSNVTTLPATEFWANSKTWAYLIKNMMLDLHFDLPGVFANTPFPNAVNGSLWTLPTEWLMYCMIAVLGTLAIMRSHAATSAILLIAIASLYFSPELVRSLPFGPPLDLVINMQAFMVGMLFQLNKERVKWSLPWVAAICVLALLKANKPAIGPFVTMLAISYTTLWFALAGSVKLYQADAWGDPSYGLYVYAFPVQQWLTHANIGISQYKLAFLSIAIVTPIAYFSWWFIEKPALDRKGKLFLRNKHQSRVV